MKVGIDLTFWFDRKISNAERSRLLGLIQEILEVNNSEYHIFGYKSEAENLKILGIGNHGQNLLLYFHSLGRISNSIFDLTAQKNFFKNLVKKYNLDICITSDINCPNYENTRRILLLTNEDRYIRLLQPPETKIKSLKRLLIFGPNHMRRLNGFDAIVTSSEHSKNTLLANQICFPYIQTVYPFAHKLEKAEAKNSKREVDLILRSYGLQDTKYIFCSNYSPELIDMIDALDDRKIAITSDDFLRSLSGTIKTKHRYARSFLRQIAKVKHRFVFTGHIDPNHMAILIQNASGYCDLVETCTIDPNLIQAQIYKIPLILKDSPLNREIASPDAVLIENQTSKIELIPNTSNLEHINKFESKNARKIIEGLFQTVTSVEFAERKEQALPAQSISTSHTLTYIIEDPQQTNHINTLKNLLESEFNNINIDLYTIPSRSNTSSLLVYCIEFLKYTLLILGLRSSHLHIFGLHKWTSILLALKKFVIRKYSHHICTISKFDILDPKTQFTISNFYSKILNFAYDTFVVPYTHTTSIIQKKLHLNPNKIKVLTLGFEPNLQVIDKYMILNLESEIGTDFKINIITAHISDTKDTEQIWRIVKLAKFLKDENVEFMIIITTDLDHIIEPDVQAFIDKYSLFDFLTIKKKPTSVELDYLLYNSKVFVNTNSYEIWGINILKAMSKQNPIVSAKSIAGIGLVKNKQNGILVSEHNQEEINLAVYKLLQDTKLRKDLAQANLIKSKKYEWKQLLKIYSNMYNMINP